MVMCTRRMDDTISGKNQASNIITDSVKRWFKLREFYLINASYLASEVIVRKPFETSEVILTTVRMTTSGFFGSNNHIIKIELASSLCACNRSPMTPNNTLLLIRNCCNLSFPCKEHGNSENPRGSKG